MFSYVSVILMKMEVSNEVRVKNEPFCYSQPISETREAKVKEEPIDIEIETSKSQIDVKAEKKFSETEEFANKTSIQTASIAFLNEDTNNSEPNKPKSK